MFRLLNEFQRGFPLVQRPYAAIGAALGATEREVLQACARGIAGESISRIGVVFAPGAIGASTLAAMEVPADELERIAGLVSAQPGVNHNYERENALNLWFVASAPSQATLDASLARISAAAAREVISLPLIEEFHIDLGFDLASGAAAGKGRRRAVSGTLDETDRRLIAAVQGGFPLAPEPFREIAARARVSGDAVLERLQRWLAHGVARRIGVVVRHRELGYRENAMAVWDVADDEVSHLGEAIGRDPAVTLCYRRARHPARWPYNLYCMVHGRDRATVQAALSRLMREHGLQARPHAVLFSVRCFKQCGARYAVAA